MVQAAWHGEGKDTPKGKNQLGREHKGDVTTDLSMGISEAHLIVSG